MEGTLSGRSLSVAAIASRCHVQAIARRRLASSHPGSFSEIRKLGPARLLSCARSL